MGVAYKVRQDVIDFIVQSKMTDSQLSCRHLVGIIKERFSADVSKSSVNAVIKEFNLSGPIGRRSVYKPPKNFAIPKEKKNILMMNIQPFLPAVEVPQGPEESAALISTESAAPQALDQEGETSLKEIEHAEPIAAESFISQEKQEIAPILTQDNVVTPPEALPAQIQEIDAEKATPVADDQSLILRPDPAPEAELPSHEGLIESLHERTASGDALDEPQPSVWVGDAGILYEKLGAAAMWFVYKSVCGNSRLGENLAMALGSLPEGVMLDQAETLFFMDFFAEHRQGHETDDLRTLWRLAGLDDAKGRILYDQLALIDTKKDLRATVETELSIAFTPVHYIRMLATQGQRWYMDAAEPRWHADFISAGQYSSGLPVFMAVEAVVDRVITNIFPCMADASSGGITVGLRQWMALMHGGGDDPIAAVELFGANDVKCAEFTMIPSMERRFIIKVRPTAEERGLVDYTSIANRNKFTDVITGQRYGYYEGALIIEQMKKPIRVLTIKPDSQSGGNEIVLLTNIAAESLSAEGVLKDYFSSAIGDGPAFKEEKTLKAFESANISSQGARLACIYKRIDDQVRHFFLPTLNAGMDWEAMCSILYNLPGHIKETPGGVFIRLSVPQEYPHQQPLSLILQDLNKAAFKSPEGKRVFWSV